MPSRRASSRRSLCGLLSWKALWVLLVAILAAAALPVVRAQSHLLSDRVLDYINTVADLQDVAAEPDLEDKVEDIIRSLGFRNLNYFWETPFNQVGLEFAQAVIGRKTSTCYGVIHGLPIDTRFIPNPQPLDGMTRRNCDDSDCSCRANTVWAIVHFPDFWGRLQTELEDCMAECETNYVNCEMVLGGFGQGGSVAALLSFEFATTDYDPYVIMAGSSNVLYDNNCRGIDEDRYFRFVNTDSPDSGSDYGICFDDVPFIGTEDGLVSVGHTIGLGMDQVGQMLALGGSGELMTFEEDSTRSSTCRSAHDVDDYQNKMQLMFMRNVYGVTPQGFSDGEYCEVDEDCRDSSHCSRSGGSFPECSEGSDSEPRETPRPTDMITPQPTPWPSDRPTDFPTFEPTHFPTFEPTPRPSPRPTDQPSEIPTPEPTKRPTPEPTPLPSRLPTRSPITPGPTARPTPGPTTARPTFAPTRAPVTVAPTGSPTGQPATAKPTPVPTTPRPTEPNDTPVPTEAPSEEPTGVPTATPTEAKVQETASPTWQGVGILQPELVATSAPTSESSASLPTTDVATSSPTGSLEDEAASNDESQTETDDTATPAENKPLPLHTHLFQITLILKGVTQKLGGMTLFRWEDETAEHMRQWIEQGSEDWDPPLKSLQVQANVVTQTLLTSTSNPQLDITVDTTASSFVAPTTGESVADRKGNGRNRQLARRLQTVPARPQALEIVFESAIAYRTLNTEDLNSMIFELIAKSFQMGDGRKQYTTRLIDSGDETFSELSDFALEVNPAANGLETQEENGNGGENSVVVWSLVAAAVVAVALSLSLFVVYVRRRDQNRKEKTTAKNSESSAPPNGLQNALFEAPASADNRFYTDGEGNVVQMSKEIVVECNEDDGVSTLGEPLFVPGMAVHADEPTADSSVKYAQNYLGNVESDGRRVFRDGTAADNRLSDNSMNRTAASSAYTGMSKVASGLSDLNESAIFADNDSFEEQYARKDECFEVEAPPGKLGIIIDLSPSGEPMVRAIRPDSALAGQVKIGDLLLSVDGAGCEEMSAEQVSKLIAVKSDQSCRRIMFVRRQNDYL